MKVDGKTSGSEPNMIVHILWAGSALCGQEGLPCDWPDDHRWAEPRPGGPNGVENANCEGCLQVHREHIEGEQEKGLGPVWDRQLYPDAAQAGRD